MPQKRKRGKLPAIAKTAVFLVVFAIAMALSFKFDLTIAKFATSLQEPFLNGIMLLVTYISSSIAVLFILTSLFLWHEHKRKWLLPLWASLFFSSAVVLALKLITARVRPFYLGLPTLIALVQKAAWWDSSFPSSHAAIAFCALPLLDKEFPKFKFVWLAFACLVGFSRIYFALHYLSDVIAGAALGYGIGLLAVKLEEKCNYSNIFKIIRKIRN